MKVQEVIELINSKQGELYSVWDAEDLLPAELARVEIGLDPDKHRFYEKSTNVYKCEDGFIGIRGVSDLFSEIAYYSDYSDGVDVFEMVEIKKVSYEKVKNL